MKRFNASVIIGITFSAERVFDAFRAQIIFKNIASILAPQIALEYHAIRTYLNLLIKIEIKERSGKDKLNKRRRSQFFQSLRNFSSQAKVRSTIQRLGITENL